MAGGRVCRDVSRGSQRSAHDSGGDCHPLALIPVPSITSGCLIATSVVPVPCHAGVTGCNQAREESGEGGAVQLVK